MASIRSLALCFVVYDPMTSGGVFRTNHVHSPPSGSSAFFAIEFASRLHNHNDLKKCSVLPSANQMTDPPDTLQGHFVRSRSISSRVTSGPRSEVELFSVNASRALTGTVHAMASSFMSLCSKTAETQEVVLGYTARYNAMSFSKCPEERSFTSLFCMAA